MIETIIANFSRRRMIAVILKGAHGNNEETYDNIRRIISATRRFALFYELLPLTFDTVTNYHTCINQIKINLPGVPIVWRELGKIGDAVFAHTLGANVLVINPELDFDVRDERMSLFKRQGSGIILKAQWNGHQKILPTKARELSAWGLRGKQYWNLFPYERAALIARLMDYPSCMIDARGLTKEEVQVTRKIAPGVPMLIGAQALEVNKMKALRVSMQTTKIIF